MHASTSRHPAPLAAIVCGGARRIPSSRTGGCIASDTRWLPSRALVWYVALCVPDVCSLQHQALLNQQLLELSLAMADVNRMAISVNSRVMETNENIVAFNAKYIEGVVNLLHHAH